MTNDDRTGRHLRASRGLLLGLIAGDALDACGGSPPGSDGPLLATSAGQLALATTEGLIRALVRHSQRGICHPPSVVWHALVRWAHGQGVAAPEAYSVWRRGAGVTWPDGWLAEVPPVQARRGTAPATVAAIAGGRQGTPEHPVTNSSGAHGLVRSLPVALVGRDAGDVADLARDVAALTHGAPKRQAAAALGVSLLHAILTSGDGAPEFSAAFDAAVDAVQGEGPVDEVRQAIRDGRRHPGELSVLRRHVEDKTAASTLAGAVYVVASFPHRSDVEAAMRFAASTRGTGVGATVGSLLGAWHGIDALPWP
ncbi:ADP-ribosylglycohydrolase family protein [Geodermatophilus nigrescens]